MNTSEIPISKTKIILPRRRAELLTRKRLLDSLYEVLDRRLIVVAAPAGYGKTSLLIDLAHHSDLPFCWLALDLLDREAQRFIAYFVAALAERFPGFGNHSLSVLNSMTSLDDGMERLLVTLVNEIYNDIQEHFVLVLDDFHLLDGAEPVQYFINRFIQLVGENCHLILSSRSLPEFSDMTLLVARDQVGGLDFADLCFKPEEIQALLAQNQQVHLSEEEAHRLAEATEGWITGLQFADLNLKRSDGSDFRPSNAVVGVNVFDYLGRQVLEQQPESLQIFLLRSSMLEEFDPALCEAVLGPLYQGPQNWLKMIETILQKNLFALPVGANGQWVRYHHLFRDYLQERFRKECPGEVTPLLQRLAKFHESQEQWEKSYQLYKQLGDTHGLADMIERAGIPMYQRAMLTLESWLKDLPPSFLQQRAGLLSLRGAIESSKGNSAEAVILFDRAIQIFREGQNVAGLALALARRGNTQRLLGNYDQAVKDAEEVMQLTEGSDELQWNYADALRVKGLSFFRQGRMQEAIANLARASDIYTRLKDSHSVPILLMESGMVYDAIGDGQRARTSYEQALAIWKQTGNLSRLAVLFNNLGFLYHREGEYERAAELFEEGLLSARQGGDRRMEALISISLGDLYTDVEDFEIARQNYERVNELVEQIGERFLVNYLAIAQANLALLEKESSRAHNFLDRIRASIETSHSRYERGLYQLMSGRLLLQEGKSHEAVAALTEAHNGFVEDGQQKEGIWSALWLAAAHLQNNEHMVAQKEIKEILGNAKQIGYFTAGAARQAREWLEELRNDADIKSLLRGLFEKMERLDRQLPRARRQIRRLTQTIEIPSPNLNICAFGPGEVWVAGKLVTMSEWQTQSVRELFFYFLARRTPLTKEQIGEALWPDTFEPPKLKLRFKNEIYRLRRAVRQETIVFENDHYQFNPNANHEYDVEAFEAHLGKARSASSRSEQIHFYQKAVDLVRGKYLEDMGSSWVWPERERLSQEFLSASLKLADLYLKEGQNSQALRACQRALTHEPAQEAVYRLMLQIYHRMGDRASIIHTYKTCEETMHRVFNLPPSQETTKLYHDLIG